MFAKIKEKHEPIELDFDAKQNLVGFFKLLLDVDRRINPLFYKQLYDRHRRVENPETPDPDG